MRPVVISKPLLGIRIRSVELRGVYVYKIDKRHENYGTCLETLF